MNNRKRYAEDWEDTIRPAILKRDGYQCVICKVRHRKSYVFEKGGGFFIIPEDEIKEWKGYGDKAYKVFLQIAHLDNDPSNNDYENLKAMCPKCHLRYDKKHSQLMRKVKMKE